jgi:hypothetical protein
MNKRQIYTAALAIILLPFLRAVPALAHGDKIVPHVVNGLLSTTAGDQKFRTKFDITNLGPTTDTPITKVKVLFKTTTGAPWLIETDQAPGMVSEVTLNLGALQTIRITTLGNGAYTQGYAIVRNLEGTTPYAEDYEVAITVYYEVLSGSDVVETVSVPLGQPTVSFGIPVEIDTSKNLGTGFAIVDLSGAQNTINLQLFQATSPTSGDATPIPPLGPIQTYLNPNEKQARMLTEAALFPPAQYPAVTKFKGMLSGTSQGPVAILGLLVTPVPTGFQYATMAPAYIDSLRRNTVMDLPQGFALDADLPVVDYFHSEDDNYDIFLETPWDLLLETDKVADQLGSIRRLRLQGGATAYIIGGDYDGPTFDGITQEFLRSHSLDFTTNPIDLSDGSPSLQVGFAFAIKTGLGRYVKVRIRSYAGYPCPGERCKYIDLMLEIFVYR